MRKKADGDVDSESVAELLREAFPSPAETASDFVTRLEFQMALMHFETKIANSELRMRNWVLVGCLGIIIAFGGGYFSLVAKIERLTESMPIVNQVLDGRRSWMLQKDQTDRQQDQAIERAVPDYKPPPYVEPPR